MSEAEVDLPLPIESLERNHRKLSPARLWWAGCVAVGSLLMTVHDKGLIQKPLGTSSEAEMIQGTVRHLGPTALAASFITRKMYEMGFSRDVAVGVGVLSGIGLNLGNEVMGYALNRYSVDIKGWQSWVVSSNPPQIMDILVPTNAAIVAATLTPLEEVTAEDILDADAADVTEE